MIFGKVIEKFVKGFLNSGGSILITIIGAGLVAFKPANTQEQIIFTIIAAGLTGTVNAIENYLKHQNDPKK